MVIARWLVQTLLFFCLVVVYTVTPALLAHKYLISDDKKEIFRQASEWRKQHPEKERQLQAQRQAVFANSQLTTEQQQDRIDQLEREHAQQRYQQGKVFHSRLLNLGITLDIPVLIGFYFIFGMIIFWFCRYRAQKMTGVVKLQYTVYLIIISLLLIITTFGFGYTASYIYDPSFWQIQSPPDHPIMFIKNNPVEASPFLATHFVIFALNASIMGPFDAYMTVKPHSLPASLMQWLQRLFVIGVLFPSIYKLWTHLRSPQGPDLEQESTSAGHHSGV